VGGLSQVGSLLESGMLRSKEFDTSGWVGQFWVGAPVADGGCTVGGWVG
jgi:hypothetical protein